MYFSLENVIIISLFVGFIIGCVNLTNYIIKEDDKLYNIQDKLLNKQQVHNTQIASKKFKHNLSCNDIHEENIPNWKEKLKYFRMLHNNRLKLDQYNYKAFVSEYAPSI